MPSLKEFRVRIESVQSTRKITSAMKMVAASKLRRAQEAAEAARPYAERMERMDDVHLVVVMTANRGLAGGFNSNIIRSARGLVRELLERGKTVKILAVGRKGRDAMRRDFRELLIGEYTELARKRVAFSEASDVASKITAMFANGEFDVATMIYARFKSAVSQIVTRQQIIPFPVPQAPVGGEAQVVYDYEPSDTEILGSLLPQNLAIQVFRAMLENSASFFGSQMAAMDNATRNAGEMINKLKLTYNRQRQAMITKELIEIISGAEAI